jgi:hypothetical protein
MVACDHVCLFQIYLIVLVLTPNRFDTIRVFPHKDCVFDSDPARSFNSSSFDLYI